MLVTKDTDDKQKVSGVVMAACSVANIIVQRSSGEVAGGNLSGDCDGGLQCGQHYCSKVASSAGCWWGGRVAACHALHLSPPMSPPDRLPDSLPDSLCLVLPVNQMSSAECFCH